MSEGNVAVDVGFGQTKWAVKLDGVIITGGFPSLAPISSGVTVSTNESMGGKRNTVKVVVGNTSFEIGPDSHLAKSEASTGRSLSEEFPTTNNYKALLLGALHYSGATHVPYLALGLPVHTMPLYADVLKKTFVGRHDINGRTIQVDNVIVIPQPVGTLAMYSTLNRAAVNNGQTRLIVDIGYVTTDWVVAKGYNMIDGRSGGRMGGVSNVLKHIAEQISNTYGGGKYDNIEDINDSFVNKKALEYYKYTISVDELHSFLAKSSPIISDVVKEIKTRIGGSQDIHTILLTGGGAAFYEKVIEETFPLNRIEILPDPSFTNAIGFLMVADRILSRGVSNG
jgi:plasmid segregation protein ParM